MGGGSSAVLSLVSLAFVICSLFAFIGKNLVIGGWTADSSQISPLRFSAGSFRLFFCILCFRNLIFCYLSDFFCCLFSSFFLPFQVLFFPIQEEEFGDRSSFPHPYPFPMGILALLNVYPQKRTSPLLEVYLPYDPSCLLADGLSAGWSMAGQLDGLCWSVSS